MKFRVKLFFIILLVNSSISCHQNNSLLYEKEISDWHAARLERLKSKTGWLNLAGLFWLKEGENSFGSDSSNLIIFPSNAPDFLGIIIKNGNNIFLKASSDSIIRVDSVFVSEMFLKSDSSDMPTLMESGSLAWYIIARDGRCAIRLRDYNHPRIGKLENIPYYKTTPNWKIVADFIPYDSIRRVEIATVTGGSEFSNCPGELVFRKGLKKYKLLPFSEGDNFFIIFADKTNGIETYGNGRFMYAPLPDSSKKVIIDFNKAYNPPCAFSPFATCPMPPQENILDLKIEAGEKEVLLSDH